MEQLRIGILGFGNLGRGAAAAVSQSPDMALAGIFTRRLPEQVAAGAGGMPVCPPALPCYPPACRICPGRRIFL